MPIVGKEQVLIIPDRSENLGFKFFVVCLRSVISTRIASENSSALEIRVIFAGSIIKS